MNLEDKILKLIDLKKEGKTWDFKEKWYTSKALLLHDLLNMANNETSEDSYIIIGIDENKDFSPIDVSKDNNRYNQNRLNNLLRSNKIVFAADNIPMVKLETIKIYGCIIDIIIIKSTDKVPYYLTKDYIELPSPLNGNKDKIIVHASNIYIRRNDSNTPINECATEIEIEKLWRKRFGLDLSVQDKFLKILSKKEDWDEYDEVYFHKFIPDFFFKIMLEDCNDMYHQISYSYEQYDNTQHTYILEYYFRNLKIGEFLVDLLDGGRMTFVRPNTSYITAYDISGRNTYSYLYFIKDDVRSKINNILVDLNNSDHKSIMKVIKDYVIFFENEEQKNQYDKYLNENINVILEESKSLTGKYININIDDGLLREKVIEEICIHETITKMYNKF